MKNLASGITIELIKHKLKGGNEMLALEVYHKKIIGEKWKVENSTPKKHSINKSTDFEAFD